MAHAQCSESHARNMGSSMLRMFQWYVFYVQDVLCPVLYHAAGVRLGCIQSSEDRIL